MKIVSKLAFAGITGLSVLSLSLVNSQAATSSPNTSAGKVYHDLATFKQAAKAIEAQRHGKFDTSPAAENARVALYRAASNILAKTHDPNKWAQFLADHGTLVYDPNAPTNDSTPSDVYISQTTPTESFDAQTGEWTVTGSYNWNSLAAIQADYSFNTVYVGGTDAMGLAFNNIPDPNMIASAYGYTYNSQGVPESTLTTFNSTVNGTAVGIYFQGQDRVLNPGGDYSWYFGTVNVTFREGWSDSGTDQMGYDHTWSSTNFKSWSVSGGKGSVSITATFDQTANSWPSNSLWGTY